MNAKIISISAITLFVISIIGYNIYAYNTPSSIWERTASSYREKLESLKANTESLRSQREQRRKDYETEDQALSGAINDSKRHIQKIELCLQAKSIDCEATDQKSLLSFIPHAYAEVATASEIADPPRSSEAQCQIGTGSHDVRTLAKYHPGVAWWKNNNPSGITLGSKALEQAFFDADIKWYFGTARPAREGSNYYGFPDLENGMRAKLLIVKRSYKNSSIASYLRVWGTDGINTHLDTSRTIASLSDDELISLMKSQIRKESGDLSEYIFENVIQCQ